MKSTGFDHADAPPDLFVTGGSGYLGSHLIAAHLRRHPQARILCLIREANEARARNKLRAAIEAACVAQGVATSGVAAAAGAIMDRIAILPGDLMTFSWSSQVAWLLPDGFQIIHCAANLSFQQIDRDEVWRTNVESLQALLAALPVLGRVRGFNYVSTAYVAGDRDGLILEADTKRPAMFNNVYEESKWTGEQLVRHACGTLGIGFRIFRPSIIIGHSASCKTHGVTGFYKVLETLLTLARLTRCEQAVSLPLPRQACLDLIPVDLVAMEMLYLIGLGARSESRAFHLTNDNPISVADILFGVSPLIGLTIETRDPPPSRPIGPSMLVQRALHHYMPYLSQVRRFDRHNVRALGAGTFQENYRLDLMRVRDFTAAFIAQCGHIGAAPAAAAVAAGNVLAEVT